MKFQSSTTPNLYHFKPRLPGPAFRRASLLLAAVLGICAETGGSSLETSFCYQGQLIENGLPANGSFDLRLALYGSAFGGIPVAGPVTNTSVAVINGLFTTTIDFGLDIFSGNTRWMEMANRPVGESEFSLSGSRQSIPTVSSDSLGTADHGTSQTGRDVTSLKPLGVDPRMELHSLDLGLAPAPVSCTTYSNCYWNLLGNGNLTAGVNFLGTVAGELDPLEFRVNNNRAMLYTFTAVNSAPNITGGYLGNIVTGPGGTIAGGGQMGGINRIDAAFGTVSGGHGNTIDPFAFDSTVGGGANNHILQTVEVGTIGGGSGNTLGPNIYFPTIGGGSGNVISGLTAATISGGMANSNLAAFGMIGGGLQNRVTGNASAIVGGSLHRLMGNDSTIGGGRTNVIEPAVSFGTIAGGTSNTIRNASLQGTIGGGAANLIGASTAGATIGGGQQNTIVNNTRYATIPGGYQAAAISYGQQAYASGRFAQNGDAQGSLYVVRNTTTTNSFALTVELFLDGVAERIHIPANAAWAYDIFVVGRDNVNQSAGYHFRGVIENNVGVTILPSLPAATVLNEDIAAWNAEVIADNANDALVVRVTGSPAAAVRWVATVRTAEVVFP